jgi:HEPN domain-containing protein
MGKEEFLKRRAMEFYKLARRNFEDGFYNISAFEIEQACQLYLKYTLALQSMESAYLSSRYLGKEYNRDEVESLLDFADKLVKFLEEVGNEKLL